MTALYVVVGLAVLTGLWVVVTNNSFIKSRNKVDEAWSGIDVQLKRRHDLVPNLVETVKGYAAHESATLAAVTQARSAAMAAGSGPDRAAAEEPPAPPLAGGPGAAAEELRGSALRGVRVVAEQYPELRAAQSYQQLMAEVSEPGDQIQGARRI